MFYRKTDYLENFRDGKQSEKVYSIIESLASGYLVVFNLSL
jgi:hypothetical protein